MRHGKTINHLGRTASHRQAMLSNMASSLILHKRIETTLAKAKALRKYVEPLLTKSKDDSTHNRRMVFSYLQNKESVKELFDVVSDKVANRPGGYTRIIRIGARFGDNAEMCIIELVDFNETLLSAAEDSAKKTRRGRRRSGGTAAVAGATAAEANTIEPTDGAEEGTVDTDDEVANEVELETAEEDAVVAEAEVEEAPVAEETTEAPAAEASEEEKPAADEADEEKKDQE